MDVSTIDVGTAQKIAAAIQGAGGQYIEAPVSGSKQPAEQGQLIFLAAGTASFLRCIFELSKVQMYSGRCTSVSNAGIDRPRSSCHYRGPGAV